MQNKQLKRPYSPPEITAVEFRVERGLQTSVVQIQTEEALMEAWRRTTNEGEMFNGYNGGDGWSTGWNSGFNGSSGSGGTSPSPVPYFGGGSYF